MKHLSWVSVGLAFFVACNGTAPKDSAADGQADAADAPVDVITPTDRPVTPDVTNDQPDVPPVDVATDLPVAPDAPDVVTPVDAPDVVSPVDVVVDVADVVAPDAGADVMIVEGGTLVATARPCGASVAPDPTLPATVTPIIDLGHTQSLDVHLQSGDRILAREVLVSPASGLPQRGHWVLWDAVHRTQIASGVQQCDPTAGCPLLDLRATTFVVGTSTGMIVRDATDAHVIATLTTNAPDGLAVDGSYAWGVTTTGLTAWSTATGAMIFNQVVAYAPGGIFAAPGEFRVVSSSSAGSMLSHIAVPSGTTTMSATLQGGSPTWFADGSHVVTMPTGSVSSGWIYAADGTLAQFVTFAQPFVFGLGNYWWSGNSLMQLGSTTAVLNGTLIGVGGNQFAVHNEAAGAFTLHIETVTATGLTDSADVPDSVSVYMPGFGDVAVPIYGTFGSDAAGSWSVATSVGLLYDHRALTQSLSCGGVSAIGGSVSGYIAVATFSGSVVIVDGRTASPSVIGYVPIAAVGALQWSNDGSVLVVESGVSPGVGGTTPVSAGQEALTAYTLMPSAVPLAPLLPPSTYFPLTFTLSGDGQHVAQSYCSSGACFRRVTSLTGTDRLGGAVGPAGDRSPAISTDGTVVAFGPTTPAIYTGATQTGTPTFQVAPLGWTDDTHLLGFVYSGSSPATYLGVGTFTPTGTMLGLVATVADDYSSVLVSPTRIFTQDTVRLHDATTGATVWSASLSPSSHSPSWENPPPPAAIAGTRAAYWTDWRVVGETIP